MAFEVSTARVDITPTMASNPYLAGSATQTAPRSVTTSQPHRTLYARCVLLWDNASPRAVVVLDVLGIPRTLHQRVRPRLRELANWRDADVVLQATHTHNGPVLEERLHPFATYGLSDLTLVQRYTAWLADAIVEVVREALAAPRTPVELEYQVAEESFSRNRRGLSYVESAVPTLVARGADGRARAVLFSYGTHPVAAGMRTEFDADFPGAACETIERAVPGCFALYLQGAAGDQSVIGVTGFELSDELGARLGNTVVDALSKTGRPVTGPITTSIRETTLPLDIATDAATIADFRSAFVARMKNPSGQPAYYQRHAEVMVGRLDSGNIETVVPFLSQLWVLQGTPRLRILLTAGELVSGYAAYFRTRYGGTDGLWIGGYANETPCYIPSEQFFPPRVTQGSYEGGWDADFPAVGGASMAAYGWPAHFRSGDGGVESVVIAALTAQLG